MGRPADDRPPLQRALDTAAGLKPGSWQSVEALALLAIETRGRPESAELLQAAHRAADGLKQGTWDSVRVLACLARADRETSG